MADQVPARPKDITGMPSILDYLLQKEPVPDEPIIPGRLRLSQILPADQWWRIYLARQDHTDAIKQVPHNPGYLYDTQQSPGFQESMVNAYNQVLEGDAYANKFTTATLTSTDYQQFYDLVTKKVKIKSRNEEDLITFGLQPGRPASDAETDLLLEHCLMGPLTSASTGKNMISALITAVPDGVARPMVCVSKSSSPGFIDAAFGRFKKEIEEAGTRKMQLYAIAKLIRFLHVLHTYGDGNGRLNVYFLLPRLLLEYGFGLPLRLGRYCCVGTLFGMFNGCFTLDQIVVFLWHAQQRPGQVVEDLDLARVKGW